jgi:hypothetical protein
VDKTTTQERTTMTADAGLNREATTTAPVRGGDVTPAELAIAVRAIVPAFTGYSDSQILHLAVSTCTAFDQGVTFDEAISAGARTLEVPPVEMARVIGVVVSGYCPEHNDVWEIG